MVREGNIDAGYDLAPSDKATFDVALVGDERHPVLIVEDALGDPAALRRFAEREVTFEPVTQNLYPGVRAPLSLDYGRAMVRALDPLIRRIWELPDAVLVESECHFSMVTTPPDRLVPFQSIPHIDTTNPYQFAALHFLCGPEGGGTAFYRQRATGYEAITAEREPAWARARDAALERARGGLAYIGADDPDYEEIALFGARMNRLLVYRSCQLHCARIPPDMAFSADPAKGRLTANLFIGYRPPVAP